MDFEIKLLKMVVSTSKYWAIIGISVEHKSSPCSYTNCFCWNVYKMSSVDCKANNIVRTKVLVYGACYKIWIRILPTIYNESSPLEWFLVTNHISQVRFCNCATFIIVNPPQRTKWDVEIDNSFRGSMSSEKFGMN